MYFHGREVYGPGSQSPSDVHQKYFLEIQSVISRSRRPRRQLYLRFAFPSRKGRTTEMELRAAHLFILWPL